MEKDAYRIEGKEQIIRSPSKPTTYNEGEPFTYTEVPLKPERLLVTQQPSLDYIHYLTGDGREIHFEMYLSTEARDLMKKLGWKKIRQLLEQEIARVHNDPFGQTSIDNTKDDPRSQKLRSVNSLGEEVEQLVGMPIATKGTGKGLEPEGKVLVTKGGYSTRENLLEQYVDMRHFQIKSQLVFNDAQKAVLEFCPVYAAVRYPVDTPEKYQEWLIMKRVVNGQQVEDHVCRGPQYYNHGREFLGFDTREHPDLAEAFDVLYRDWNSLFWRFNGNEMGLRVSDISGRNVLWTLKPDGRKFYTIIDQRFRE